MFVGLNLSDDNDSDNDSDTHLWSLLTNIMNLGI